jgi:hypothetical protein
MQPLGLTSGTQIKKIAVGNKQYKRLVGIPE